MIVRKARPADEGDIFALAEIVFTEAPQYRQYRCNADKVRAAVEDASGGTDRFMFVAEQDTRVVGIIWGAVLEHPVLDLCYAANIALAVHPDHRGSTAAQRLIAAFEREAYLRGAQKVVLVSSSGLTPARTTRLFEALGYEPAGSMAAKHFGD